MTPQEKLIEAFKQALAEGMSTQEIVDIAQEFEDTCFGDSDEDGIIMSDANQKDPS